MIKRPPILIQERNNRLLNLNDYQKHISAEDLCIEKLNIKLPESVENILRMPLYIKNRWYIPKGRFDWCFDFINFCVNHNKRFFNTHPYWYLTVRNDQEDLENRSGQWHVDGFSTRIPQKPEINYIWCSDNPTLFYENGIKFPINFNGRVHNIHKYIQKNIEDEYIKEIKPKNIYLLDPYVIHRKPDVINKGRVFVRLSNVPIEIEDDLYTPNPLLPMKSYNRIGKDICDNFIEY